LRPAASNSGSFGVVSNFPTIGNSFTITGHFQPISELTTLLSADARTPNPFQRSLVDSLIGIRIYPHREKDSGVIARRDENPQGRGIFYDRPLEDPLRNVSSSQEPHGYIFQFWAGRRNERAPTVVPNNPPTTAVSASPSRVVLAANCGPDQIPAEGCVATSSTVQLAANATDPDGDMLLYTWSTTGGSITGDGSNVTWDLSDVQPGTYTASVEVDDGCGCIAFSSATVMVESCGCESDPATMSSHPYEFPLPIVTEHDKRFLSHSIIHRIADGRQHFAALNIRDKQQATPLQGRPRASPLLT
jgi:hypothetical protein